MANFNIDYLVVAGGGGGGYLGGGGGAGGYRTSFGTGNISGGQTPVESSLTLTAGTQYTVSVGALGIRGTSHSNSGPATAGNGGDSGLSGSGITTITSIGGGGGGNHSNNGGASGGSGGGGASSGNANPGGARTAGQGSVGAPAQASSPYNAGGGGGAFAAGFTPNGGTAMASLITGVSTLRAGGGGGGTRSASGASPSSGGGGGAGNGGNNSGDPSGGNATAFTGSGGGGGGYSGGNPYGYGGNGGSGVVILRYTTADIASYTATGITPTEDTTTISGQTILSFTTVGTGYITFTAPPPPTIGTRVTNPVTGFNSTNSGMYSTEEGLKLPSGNSASKPTGVQGMIRNNTGKNTGGSASAIEHYNGAEWEYFAATESTTFTASSNFNTVLYNGSSSDQSITSVGFQPDLVWVKCMDVTNSHVLSDSLRGDSTTRRYPVFPNLNNAQSTTSSQIKTIDSYGFTAFGNSNAVNRANQEYVAWNWKAGGLINKSADFNGSSSYIQTSLSLNAASNSISFWFNADSVGSQNFCLYFNNRGGRIDININGTGSNTPSAGAESIFINSTTAITGWNFVSIVFTGWASSYSAGSYGSAITANVYLNGGVAVSVNPTPYGQSDGLRIGRSGGGYYYDGLIGQVRVFDSALTSLDVTALYNETAADNSVLNYPAGAGCIAAYPLGENANDLSNTYNGTASNVTFGKPGYLTRNTEGTIESTVSANVAAGFSIVTGSAPSNGYTNTFGHGLGQQPDIIITKLTNVASDWIVIFPKMSNGLLKLNTTGSFTYDSLFAGTSTTLKTGYTTAAFDFVAYCFASVSGYSKIDSYVGNGNTTGVFEELGFEPAFLMFKCASTGPGNWIMIDNKRATSNPRTPHLRANTSGQDDPGANEYVDFTSTGFQPKGVSNYNNNSLNQTYIYMAFATS